MSYLVQRSKPFFEIDGKEKSTMDDVFSFVAVNESGDSFVGVWSSIEECFVVARCDCGEEEHAGVDIFCIGRDFTYTDYTIENFERQIENSLHNEKILITEVSTTASLFYDYLKH